MVYRKQEENKACKINRTDVVAEGQQQFGLPAGDFASLIAFRRYACTHGKSAQEADNQHINAGIGQAE